jgi:F0F1-type ATP synthase membrane subunit a
VLAEGFYLFILEMVEQQAGKKAFVYFPLFFTTFFFILGANLVGLTPFAFYTYKSYNNYLYVSVCF